MNPSPRVSVIIPFLNGEKFIQEAIDSVIAQSFDSWEVLLIDDGSSDYSTDIAREYAEKFPDKIFYLEHEEHQNHGTCVSRNLGIRQSKGDYIALLDADDVWLPHKLERQVALLDSYPDVGMLYGANQYWKSWTGHPEDANSDFVPQFWTHTQKLFLPPELAILSYPLGKGYAPCPSDLLLRREVVQRIGGFVEDFPKDYQLYEDQAFLLKVYLATSVLVVNECWDLYRLHPHSCVAKAIANNQYEVIRAFFFNWLEEYLSKQGLKETEVWHLLQKRLWTYRHPILSKSQKIPLYFAEKIKTFFRSIIRILFSQSIHPWLKSQFLNTEK